MSAGIGGRSVTVHAPPPPTMLTLAEVLERAEADQIDRPQIISAIQRLRTETGLSAEEAAKAQTQATAAALRNARARAQQRQDAKMRTEAAVLP